MYQSYKLLSGPSPNVRPHDFMDDLESFFYVLCHVTFLYNPGRLMKSVSSHEILCDWMAMPKAAANAKFVLLFQRTLSPLAKFESLSTEIQHVFRKLHGSLCTLLVPHVSMISRAYNYNPVDPDSPNPMQRFVTWKKYKTAATDAYDSFLRPVNDAIKELQKNDPDWCRPVNDAINEFRKNNPNWCSQLNPLPSLDSGASEVDSGRSSPVSLSLSDDGPQAGSSLSLPLSLPHDSSTHTSRSSSKRPRSPVSESDGPASLEYESAGASGSDARSGSGAKRSKGPAR